MKTGELKQIIRLPMLIFYGVGTMLGAGIYILIGEVVAVAGYYTPHAFILSTFLAGFTAFSIAELSSRFPKSSGIVEYIDQGFKNNYIAKWSGIMMFFTGIVSAATMVRGLVGYLRVFVDIPTLPIIILIFFILSLISIWGIKQSMITIAIITSIEVLGLILIIILGYSSKGMDSYLNQINISGIFSQFSSITIGAFLAFYAFIGFEDIVNLAEETVQPKKNIPKAILWSLAITTVLYVSVAIVAVSGINIEILSKSEAPMSDLLSVHHPKYSIIVGWISIVAVLNGALVQIIMCSRLLFGMSQKNLAPGIFSRILQRKKTPIYGIIISAILMILLASLFPLNLLAEITSFIIIILFLMSNLALLRIKQNNEPDNKTYHVHSLIPVLGSVLSGLFMLFKLWEVLSTSI